MREPIHVDREAVYEIRNAAELCGQTNNAMKTAIKTGELRATRRNRRTYIEGEALHQWITGRPQADEASE